MRFTRISLALLTSILFSTAMRAQSVAATGATTPPTPGVGHDYITGLQETVDPASGQLSMRLKVPVPEGRGPTLPFSFAYDSAAINYAGETWTEQTQGQYHAAWFTNTSPIQVDGWSYSIPATTYNSLQRLLHDSNGRPVPCTQFTGYTFQDPNGGVHNLRLGFILPQPQTYPCNFASLYTDGGDAAIQGTMRIGTGAAPGAITVTEQDGTVYGPNATSISYSSGGKFNMLVPSNVEDRNGNKITTAFNTNTSTIFLSTYAVTDSLGRTALSASGFGSGVGTVSVSGLSQPYTVTWENIPFPGFSSTSTVVGPNPNGPPTCNGVGTGVGSAGYQGNYPVVQSITLPNGQQYSFAYDTTYGALNRITYPSGGYVSYVWGLNNQSASLIFSGFCQFIYDKPAILHRYVSFDGSTIALQQDFYYSTTWNPSNSNQPYLWQSKQTRVVTTVKTPDGRSTSYTTVYTYTPYLPPSGWVNTPPGYDGNFGQGNLSNPDADVQVPSESSIVYEDSTGSTLRTVTKGWGDPLRLGLEQITLENGQTSKTAFTYGIGMQVTEKDEYDYGSGAPGNLLRKTVTNYHVFPNTPIYPSAPSIQNLPDSTIIYDGSGTKVAETDYAYDGGSLPGSPCNGCTLTGHDETHYGPSSTAPRGNLTQKTSWLNAGGASPVETYTYDETGQRLTLTNANNNTTNYSYLDSYSIGSPPNQTNAFLTKTTYPPTATTQIETFSYAYADGKLTLSTDQNGQQTQSLYNDSFRRLTEVDYPDGGKTTYTYNDSPYNSSTPSPSVTTTKAITSSSNLTALTAFDGLGHTVRSVLTSDPDCASGDRTDTTYDGLGRVYTVSNPYCVAGEPTSGVTSYTYDALGRTTQVTHPDNSTILTTYAGRATQVQDEGNGTRRVTRISQVDALGRLVSLCEVTSATQLGSSSGTPAACGQDISGTGFLTAYGHDALGNLTSVSQNGLNGRSFQYDSLSRLTSATNPESGTTTYGYDANSNVTSKTDARGITTCFGDWTGTSCNGATGYDPLNRLLKKTHSDGTPAAIFNYDQTSALGVTLTKTIGRKSSESTGGSSPTGSVFSYDPMGRAVDNSQCTPQNCGTGVFAFQYPQYDFLGDLISGTNAAGVTFTYSYNTAARLTSITTNFVDPSHPGTLFSSARYAPFGPLTSSTLGNSLNESLSYDKRLREQSYSATSGSTTRFSFNITNFAPNSDVLAVNDSVNGNWTYSYDDFNRLSGSNQNSGQAVYSYVYDRFGNRWQQNGQHSMQLSFSGANNRMDGYSYDAAGNLLNDGSHNYFYDAENRLIQVDGTLGNCSTATACYVYDAEGRRVRKTTSAGSLDFLYDTERHKVAEVDTTGTFQRGELYASGRHFAVFAPDPGPNGAAFFIHADWLGTERARTNMGGAACETITSLPFGDGQTITDNCGDSAGDVSPMHFTGKERDFESGLDYFGARYDSSSIGRFMSVDPLSLSDKASSAVGDPQSWNAYAYVRNNPVNLIDPTGMLYCMANYSSCVSDADYNKMVEIKDYHYLFYTVYIDDKLLRAAGLTPAQFMNIAQRIYAEWQRKKDPNSPKAAMAGVGAIGLAGSETGPGDLLVIAAAAIGAIALAQNAKHNKEIMDGLAIQIQIHLDYLAGGSQNPDPRGGWKKEVRAALERMQRVGKRLGDNAMQRYKDIMERAAKALEEDAE